MIDIAIKSCNLPRCFHKRRRRATASEKRRPEADDDGQGPLAL